MNLLEKKAHYQGRKEELERQFLEPSVQVDQAQLQIVSIAYHEVSLVLKIFRELEENTIQVKQVEQLRNESEEIELRELAEQELVKLQAKEVQLQKDLRAFLLPRDPDDERNVIMEIRGAAGGEEAALFAAQLFRMYANYAEKRKWKIEVLSSNPTDLGGFKEIILEIKGKEAFSRLKFEGGAHRVQRVPATESSGRLHTSTATVVVLPEAEEVDVQINPDDLRIDVYRSSGHGGQCVQKTDSAVRITHFPSGLVVTCQDERSQLQNKERAMTILRSRLLEIAQREQSNQITSSRRLQVKSGDRSEKIRTYNFPQNRLTDHRIGLDFYNLPVIMEGNLDELLNALESKHIEERMEEETSA
ncbi:MAG: peptide chain release factor 1 [Coprothermobacterota bacterium]|nr:peptide chain release factor 1 [Coprothermobacterota bacterium]